MHSAGTQPEARELDRVSVIIPTFNRAGLLVRAVVSALDQCTEGDEVIVVDDGSTDDTREVLIPFRDRITYHLIPNGGVSRARNEGLRLARNPLVAFLDSDDEWLPHKTDLQRRLMTRLPEILFCFSETRHELGSKKTMNRAAAHHLHTRRLGIRLLGPGVPFSSLAQLCDDCEDFPVHVGDMYASLIEGPAVWCTTAMVRSAPGRPRIYFPEDISYSEDWEYFSELARQGPAAFMDRELAIMHIGHGSPQLIDSGGVYRAETRMTVLQRVWGNDPEFLRSEPEAYHSALKQLRVMRVRRLVLAGDKEEARVQLRLLKEHHILLRFLNWMPTKILLLGTQILWRPTLHAVQSALSWDLHVTRPRH